MNAREKDKLVATQRMLKLARDALQKIAHTGAGYRASMIADEALEKIQDVEIAKGLSRFGPEIRP